MPIDASSGWEQGLKKSTKNTLDRAASSGASASARMHSNAASLADTGEPLVCPSCRREHDTGLYCVDCDVELVGESFVDSVQPTKRKRESYWFFKVVVTVGLSVLVLSMIAAIFWGY